MKALYEAVELLLRAYGAEAYGAAILPQTALGELLGRLRTEAAQAPCPHGVNVIAGTWCATCSQATLDTTRWPRCPHGCMYIPPVTPGSACAVCGAAEAEKARRP